MSLVEDRQDSLIKVTFPCVGILLEQRKRGLRVVKNNTFEEGGKRGEKSFFSESTQNGKVKLMIKDSCKSRTSNSVSERESWSDVFETGLIYLGISNILNNARLLGIWTMVNRYPVECGCQGHKSTWDLSNKTDVRHYISILALLFTAVDQQK